MPEIVLAGCAPIPLASYLKALGVFRIVAEQKDKNARGCWRDETFVLDTALTEKGLVCFFLHEYRPSPIISPWNGRAGFLEGEDEEDSTRSGAELVRALRETTAPRFAPFKSAVDTLLSVSTLKELNSLRDQRKKLEAKNSELKKKGCRLSEEDAAELKRLKKRESFLKRRLIVELRGAVSEEVVDWMDACWRIGTVEEVPPPSPLLGSGGNDGSRDLGVNFGQQLNALFEFQDVQGKPKPETEALLESAIFGTPAVDLKSGAIGQFAPAQVGPNAGVGFGDAAPLNPWDTSLSLEGSLSFAGAATRRLGAARSESAFPFTVDATGAGGAGSVLSDKSDTRGEVWMPLWRNSANFSEIAALLAEGRATLRHKPVRDGVDFARAVVTLGINRGISSFQRYGFVKREGRSYIAAPLARVPVQRNDTANLLNDLDGRDWLQRFRNYARGKNAPARLRSLALRLDEAIFAMTQDASPRAVQRVLAAVGDAASYLASSPKSRDSKEGKQKPPPRLRSKWFQDADDGSAEFRIASALAGIGRSPLDEVRAADDNEEEAEAVNEPDVGELDEIDNDSDIAARDASDEEKRGPTLPPPFRAHLAPLKEETWYERFRAWSDRDGLAVWGAGSLERNLIAVAERRLVFAAQRKLDGGPFDARAPADLASALAFLWRDTDDEKIAGLAQGLAWADAPSCISMQPAQPVPLPLAYAVMKPFFASIDDVRAIEGVPKDIRLPVPPGLIARLRTGDVGAAMALACRRARASGLPISFEPRREDAAGIDGPRLLAALLIPIRKVDLRRVLERAYPRIFENKETPEPKEDAANAA